MSDHWTFAFWVVAYMRFDSTYLLIDWFIIFHFTHPKQRVPRLLNNNIKTKHRILTSQSFQKIWLESKWYLPFSSSRGKFFGSNRTSKIKVVLFFRMECSRWKFKFPFFKPSLILVSGFCSWFFGFKMELICVNIIIGKCNSEMKFTRVLNFTDHLPNPWTNLFAHVNCKQPEFSSNDRLPFCLQIILCNRLDGITQYKFVGVVAPLQISLLSLLATSFYHKGGNHCKFAVIFSFSWLAE